MKKGFTLIEVLIVVVIIGVLAALIVPRMTAQVDKAKAAEALQTVGMIKRAAEQAYDLTGSYPAASINANPGSIGDMSQLGLKAMVLSNKWQFTYFGGGKSFATSAQPLFDPVVIGYSANENSKEFLWTCRDPFELVNGDSTQGCKLK